LKPEPISAGPESRPEPPPEKKAVPLTETLSPGKKSQPTARELFSTILDKLDSLNERLAEIERKLD
jgi:hypothetical protein